MVHGGYNDPFNMLSDWVDQQIDGLNRSSTNIASEAALRAFERVKTKIEELSGGER